MLTIIIQKLDDSVITKNIDEMKYFHGAEGITLDTITGKSNNVVSLDREFISFNDIKMISIKNIK